MDYPVQWMESMRICMFFLSSIVIAASVSARQPTSLQDWQSKHPKIYECSRDANGHQSMDASGSIHVIEPCSAGVWHQPLAQAGYAEWVSSRQVRRGASMAAMKSEDADAIGGKWPTMNQGQRKDYYCSKFPRYFAMPVKTVVDQSDMLSVKREYELSGCKG